MDNHVAMTLCFYCQEGKDILLAQQYHHDTHGVLQPRRSLKDLDRKVIDMEPCPKCKSYMQQGVILITIDPDRSDEGWDVNTNRSENWMPNPFRAGGWFVVSDAYVTRAFSSMAEQILKCRWTFIDHKAAGQLGLLEAVPTGLPSESN